MARKFKKYQPVTKTEIKRWQKSSPYSSQGYFVTAKNDMRVYKFTLLDHFSNSNLFITELKIPKGARIYITEGKCRADRAYVVKHYHTKKKSRRKKSRILGKPSRRKTTYGWYSNSFLYTVKENVVPGYFSLLPSTCNHGIHFFLTVDETLELMNRYYY